MLEESSGPAAAPAAKRQTVSIETRMIDLHPPLNAESRRQVEPWDDAEPPDPSLRRAARWTWGVGGLEIFAAGCLSTMLGVIASRPLADLQRELAGQLDEAMMAQVRDLHASGFAIAAAYTLLGVVPGVALVIAGMGVEQGSARAARVALGIVVAQAFLLIWLLLTAVVVALSTAQPMALTLTVLLVGTMLGLLIATWRALSAALREIRRQRAEEDAQPWTLGPTL